MNYALILSYRGAGYAGWQRQENAVTVQQRVEEALSDLLETPVAIHAASRTDAGVHARGQVAHLNLESEFPIGGLLHGVNQRLPEDIRVMTACRMPDGFHARKLATSKEYRYRIVRCRVLSPMDALFAVRSPRHLDLEKLFDATARLVGRHDFTAFALSGGSHRQPWRTIHRAEWHVEDPLLELQIDGDGFLRGMVRSIVGTLLEVGRGRLDAEQFAGLLTGRSRAEAGPTAPARGLTLHHVEYPPEWSPEGQQGGNSLC